MAAATTPADNTRTEEFPEDFPTLVAIPCMGRDLPEIFQNGHGLEHLRMIQHGDRHYWQNEVYIDTLGDGGLGTELIKVLNGAVARTPRALAEHEDAREELGDTPKWRGRRGSRGGRRLCQPDVQEQR